MLKSFVCDNLNQWAMQVVFFWSREVRAILRIAIFRIQKSKPTRVSNFTYFSLISTFNDVSLPNILENFTYSFKSYQFSQILPILHYLTHSPESTNSPFPTISFSTCSLPTFFNLAILERIHFVLISDLKGTSGWVHHISNSCSRITKWH